MFRYETSTLLENFNHRYMPDQFLRQEDKSVKDKPDEVIKCLSIADYAVTDYEGIPSTFSLLQAEACPVEDTREFKQKIKKANAPDGMSDEIRDQSAF